MEGLFGKGRYDARTPWTGWAAAAAVVAILAIASVLAALTIEALQALAQSVTTPAPQGSPLGGDGAASHASLSVMLLAQILMVLATIWAASRQDIGRGAGASGAAKTPVSHVLALNPVSARTIAASLIALLLFLGVYNGIVHFIDPGAWYRDLAPFKPYLHSSSWWLFLLVIGIGAPLSEELLFRGFLLPALAQTRLGFAGAAVATTAGWTVLHWGYSAAGILEVFLIGLALSFILWRTGSLWVAIACHGIYNLLLALLLWLVVG